jgi:hypothetical protein
MKNDSELIVSKPLSDEARHMAEKLSLEFSEALLLQAKILARSREKVLQEDVKLAQTSIYNSRLEIKLWQEMFILFGGIFLGASISGFANELLQQPPAPIPTAIYVALGFFGMILIFLGYMSMTLYGRRP